MINVEEYDLIPPSSINIINENHKFIDIEVEHTNNFFIAGDYGNILTHNCDGIGHIASLLINFFALWFPKLIEKDRLFILQTPLISEDIGKKRNYYNNLEDLKKAKGTVRYLKGLGSLDVQDWEYVFKNLQLLKIKMDKEALRYLKMAFGNDVQLRKRWLKKGI